MPCSRDHKHHIGCGHGETHQEDVTVHVDAAYSHDRDIMHPAYCRCDGCENAKPSTGIMGKTEFIQFAAIDAMVPLIRYGDESPKSVARDACNYAEVLWLELEKRGHG